MATASLALDKKDFGDVSGLEAGNVYDLVIQSHEAKRAGPHLDLRIGNPKLGLLSWAIPANKLPGPGEKALAVQQPVHAYGYKDFTGTIEKGYGAGVVSKSKEGQVLILENSPDKILFTVASDRYPQRYALIRAKGKNWGPNHWLLINITQAEPLVYTKQSLKLLDPGKLENWLATHKFSQVQPKIDGAHGLLAIDGDRLELYSYRVSKKNGWPIVHTERVFKTVPKLKIPSWLNGTVIRGEIYGVYKRGGKEVVIPPNVLSAILNAAPVNSFARMLKDNIELRFAAFDISRYGSELIDFDVPYNKRYSLVKDVVIRLDHPQIHTMSYVNTPEKALELWNTIKAGKHPLTTEGIVIYPETGIPIKVKTFKEADVYIRDIVPGTGKYSQAAGGFQYSRDPDGPIVGVVGTGFDDEMRFDMMKNKDEYIGRRARVKYQEEFPSGSFRAPVFIALHEDYPQAIEKKAGIDILDEQDPRWLAVFDLLDTHYKLKKIAKDSSFLDFPILEALNDVSLGLQSLIGGPNPLTSMLLYGGLGAGLGLLAKTLFNNFIATGHFDRKLSWRFPILTGVLASLPSLLTHVIPSLYDKGLQGLVSPTPLQEAGLEPDETLDSLLKSSSCEIVDDLPEDTYDLFYLKKIAKIDAPKFVKFIKRSEALNPWEKAILGGLVYNAYLKNGANSISIHDIIKQANDVKLTNFHGEALGQLCYLYTLSNEEDKQFEVACKKLAGMIRDTILWGIYNG